MSHTQTHFSDTNFDSLLLGVDIGGTNIKMGLMTSSGELLHLDEYPLLDSGAKAADVSVSTIISHIASFLTKHVNLKSSIYAIGVGCPGIIDNHSGYVKSIANIPGLEGVNLRDKISKYFDMPTIIDNDANMAALGEYTWGGGAGQENMVMVTIGTDIGASLILGGNIYRGDQFAAGELGHVSVVPNGVPCSCGSQGCLGRYVSRDGIVNSYRELSKNVDLTQDYLSPKILAKLADEGDEYAQQAFEQAGHYLGFALAGIVNLLNPTGIVLGGGLSRAGAVLLDPMRISFQKYALEIPAQNVVIKQAELGNNAGVIGAATTALSINHSEEVTPL